jgi:hypothetical protein
MTSRVRVQNECPGMEDFPLRILGIVLIICLDVLPYLAYLFRNRDSEYEKAGIDEKEELNLRGCTCVSISRTWRVNASVLPFGLACISMIIVYSICLYDGWAIATLCIVIGLAAIVFICNGKGFESLHSMFAFSLFSVLYGLQLAANTVYFGWFIDAEYSTAGSVITIISTTIYMLLLCDAIAWSLLGMDPEHKRLANKRWPNWIAFLEHLFIIMMGSFLMLVRGAYA